jgi:ABC-2 type transport system ATP-binding protein
MNRTEPTVHAENLGKVFRDFWRRPKVRALTDVNFKIMPGEVFGLLGPNGSGKSTTLKLILGLLYPTGGKIEVLGRSPREVAAKARIGYLPEESYLYRYLTARETLDFYGSLFNLDTAGRKKRTAELLDMVGLAHAARRNIGEFSKGMARRIGLAQALINDPDFIVLDEPTSGLDPTGCRQVKDLILALAARGKTILLASHLLADVEDVCDRIAILYDGRIRAQGNVRELLEERDSCRLTMDALPPETMKKVLEAVRKETGNDPSVDHPTQDLEQFFLKVIEEARQAGGEASGVSKSKGLAPFLVKSPDEEKDPR